MQLSRRWQFSVDLFDKVHDTDDWTEVVRACDGAVEGVVVARGDGGEQVDLEFNASHASILLVSGNDLLRPYFPHRSAASQDIGEFFCGGCNLRVGDMDGFLARSMSRADGFRLGGALFSSGGLPLILPGAAPGEVDEVIEWRDYPRPE